MFSLPVGKFCPAYSDCVPTSIFEVAELAQLMTDEAHRTEAMRRYTMASSSKCPPAVMLMTESKAELNAGLIIVTGHAPVQHDDVAMNPEGPLPEHTADADMPPAVTATASSSTRCGMAQILATIGYGIQGLRRGVSIWGKARLQCQPRTGERQASGEMVL